MLIAVGPAPTMGLDRELLSPHSHHHLHEPIMASHFTVLEKIRHHPCKRRDPCTNVNLRN
jgi:hypothetical protein